MDNDSIKLVLNNEDKLNQKLVVTVLVTGSLMAALISPDQTHYGMAAGMIALTLICLALIWWVLPEDHYVLFTRNHVDFYKRTLRFRYRLSNRIPLEDIVKIRFKQNAGRYGNTATQFFFTDAHYQVKQLSAQVDIKPQQTEEIKRLLATRNISFEPGKPHGRV